MPARRLPAPLHPGAVRGAPITLVVDGGRVPAFAGEPVAAALLAAGRPVLSRSFRFHRPRGLMCSTGQCGWCECRIDGRPSVRSCRVDAVDGLVVEGEHAWPTVAHDLLGGLDLGSRWIVPTFYHHRFLRPRRLRKRYLEVIRWFGGRGRLGEGTGSAPAGPPSVRPIRSLVADVVVVGGGPAGLASARAALDAGATVVLLEAEADRGGPWRWRAADLPGGGPLAAMVAALDGSAGMTTILATTVVSVDVDGVHAIAPEALVDVQARSVVIATGSYERLPTVRGNDRPGVLGARTVEWLVRRHGIVPGGRAVLVGTGPDLDRAGAALRATGAAVVAIAPDALVAIDGRSRVSGVHARIDGSVRRIAADLVVIGDRAPAAELAHASGGLAPAGPAVHLAGSASGRPIETPADLEAAASVGWAAATGAEVPEGVAEGTATGLSSSLPVRAMVCFCEDVRVDDVARERHAGYGDPELLKRRTGALTGPCQGKYCATAFCAAAGMGPGSTLPTSRPPAHPIRLGDLVAGEPSAIVPDGRAP